MSIATRTSLIPWHSPFLNWCTFYTIIYYIFFKTSTCSRAHPDSYLVCGNKMLTRCNRGFYCRSYCLLYMFRASLCPSSGAQEYYTVVAACGILCCGFSSCWSGVKLRVMRPVCMMLQLPDDGFLVNRNMLEQFPYFKMF